MEVSLSVPHWIPTNFVLLPLMLVAFSYLSSIGHSFTIDLKFRDMICVSSANCDTFMTASLMGIPSISVSASIRRVSPSAIIRKASGEKGKGLSLWNSAVNGEFFHKLPFTLTYLVGGECGCDSIAAIMIKLESKLRASSALW
jgi:hypothetical protein